jgi:hypothetical protein
VAVTTTAANSFIIDGSSFNHNFTITATGANQTKRSSQFVVTDSFTDVMSTIPATSIGSYTVSYSSSSSTDFFLIAVEVLAAVAAPTFTPRRALMGVGI